MQRIAFDLDLLGRDSDVQAAYDDHGRYKLTEYYLFAAIRPSDHTNIASPLMHPGNGLSPRQVACTSTFLFPKGPFVEGVDIQAHHVLGTCRSSTTTSTTTICTTTNITTHSTVLAAQLENDKHHDTILSR